MDITLQDQLYIWCGVLSGLWIIFAIGFIILCCYVNRLSRQISRSQERATVVLQHRSEPEYASYFGSPAILPGEELAIRGFSERNPKHHDANHQASVDSMVFANEYPKPVQPPVRHDPQRQSGRPRNTLLNNSEAYQQNRQRSDGNENPNFIY